MFVRNSWYVAAWSEEVGLRQPLARTVIGDRLVLFRTSDGGVAVLEDRCAHRHMPLSLGRISEDDRLICPYHGLTYGGDGACVHVPGQETPGAIRIRSYPVEERAGLVFVWMGPPGRADADEIPDCSWLDRPEWNRSDLYRHAHANYLLLNDNLADLLHVAYLHIPSGGGNEGMGAAEMTLEVEGFGYDFQRHSRDIPAPAGYGRLSNATGNIDRWHVVEFRGPSFYRIHTGVAEVGNGGPDNTLPAGQGRWDIRPHHFITPETERTTHYFQVIAHESPPSSDSWRFLNAVIDEDVWAIEHQQDAIDRNPDVPMQTIPSDGPTLAMREIVERMTAAEGNDAGAVSAGAV
jgi:vanillate O-demethylase monooxygenase subunit